jgi:hypothetical protein
MDMGMVMMPKMGVPRDGAMGGSMGSTSATKGDTGPKPATSFPEHLPLLVESAVPLGL